MYSTANVPFARQNKISFFVPGSRHYDNGKYSNKPQSFVNISITGTECHCRCAHCNGRLLNTMYAAEQPDKLINLVEGLAAQGCKGVLISGGACANGSVPLEPFGSAIKAISEMGLKVVVHPGLLTSNTAQVLAEAQVSRVALDLIGDEDTIKSVYHISKKPADYRESLKMGRQAGLKVSPHIVVGLHFGQIRGEYEALNMVAEHGADSLVLVVLMPMRLTAMANVEPPAIEKVARLFKAARKMLPDIPISLGCARPIGAYARMVEQAAINAQFEAIAYPSQETVSIAEAKGLRISYQEYCCGIMD